MIKRDILQKKKWLRDRKRANKIRKQINYLSKTHKGTDKLTLQEISRRIKEKDKKNEEEKE